MLSRNYAFEVIQNEMNVNCHQVTKAIPKAI